MRPDVPTGDVDVPRRLSGVSPDWLTRVMRESGILRAATVTSAEFEQIGVFSNELWRVRVGYDRREGDAPRSLVLKRPKPGGGSSGFANEIRFYRSLDGAVPVLTPRFVFGALDEKSGVALLLLEEVEALAPVSFMRGVEPEHADRALAALARLHSHWWGRTAELHGFPALSDPAFRASTAAAYDRGWESSRDYFVDAGHGAFVEIGDALHGRVARSLVPLGEPATLLHGDAHFENLPLRGDEVVFLDWASAHCGSASFDLAVFMVQSFLPEARKREERGRVAAHAAAVTKGSTGWTDPWLDYRRSVLYWVVHMLQDARLQPGQAPWVVIDRYVAAATDLRVGDLLS